MLEAAEFIFDKVFLKIQYSCGTRESDKIEKFYEMQYGYYFLGSEGRWIQLWNEFSPCFKIMVHGDRESGTKTNMTRIAIQIS